MEPERPEDGRPAGARVPAMRLAGVGMELAAAVGGGCVLGYWFDLHFGTGPWGLLTGAMVGIVGGLYNLIRPVLRDTARSVKGGRDRRDRSGRKADS